MTSIKIKRTSALSNKGNAKVSVLPVPPEEYWGNRAMLLERIRLCTESFPCYHRYLTGKAGSPIVGVILPEQKISIAITDLRYLKIGEGYFFQENFDAQYLGAIYFQGKLIGVRHFERPEQIVPVIEDLIIGKKIRS